MFWMLFYYLAFCLFISAHSKHICENGTTSANVTYSDEIAFFESADFPTLREGDNENLCSINFVLNETAENKNTRGLLIFTNIISYFNVQSNIYMPPKFQIFKDNISVSNIITTTTINFYEAIQGFILFDDWGNDDCPLESISRVDPFHFTDETQIIYVQSNYPNSSRTHPCLWQFTAPKGYGFKFVIQELNISAQAQLTISNSTNIIQTERSVEPNTSFYNSDNYLRIYLSNSSSSSNTEISVYLTLIKNDWEAVDGNCSVKKYGNAPFWGNMNLNAYPNFYGYPSNGRCSYDLIVRKGIEVMADITMLTEPYVDYIEYFDESTNITEVLVSKDTYSVDNQHVTYTKRFYANDDGSDRLIKWNFVSDGSVEFLGFNIFFYETNCFCINSTIILPCSNDPLIIFAVNNDYHPYQPYCGNLHCNFTLKMNPNCPKPFFFFDFQFSSNFIYDDSILDIYRIYSNSKTILEISRNSLPRTQNKFFIPSSTNTTIEIITTPHNFLNNVDIQLNVVASEGLDVQNKIILSAENPFFGYESQQLILHCVVGGLFTVEIQSTETEKNAEIEMHSTHEWPLLLYSDENFTEIFKEDNCFDNASPYSCTIKKNYLVIFLPETKSIKLPFFFFKYSLAKLDGCAFNNNIFILNNEDDQIISAVAKSYGSCKIYVIVADTPGVNGNPLYYRNFHITKYLWTSSKNEDVRIYTGWDSSKLILNFNSKSASTFKNILMVSRIYMIEIPENSSLMITLKLYHLSNPNHRDFTVNVESYPFQSVITTLDYGINTYRPPDFRTMSIKYQISDSMGYYNFKFTVLDYNITSLSECRFKADNRNNSIVTKTNETFVFHETTLIYSYDKNGVPPDHANAGILFHVELIKSSG